MAHRLVVVDTAHDSIACECHVQHLRSLPRTVGYLTALRTLNVRGNRLEELPAEVGALCDLLTLNVSMNHLKAVPETMR